MFSRTPEKFENATITSDRKSVNAITWLSWRHRSRKPPFSKCSLLHCNAKPAFSNSSGLMSVFEKPRFRDGLVWTVKIKLRFQIWNRLNERLLDASEISNCTRQKTRAILREFNCIHRITYTYITEKIANSRTFVCSAVQIKSKWNKFSLVGMNQEIKIANLEVWVTSSVLQNSLFLALVRNIKVGHT